MRMGLDTVIKKIFLSLLLLASCSTTKTPIKEMDMHLSVMCSTLECYEQMHKIFHDCLYNMDAKCKLGWVGGQLIINGSNVELETNPVRIEK